MALIAPLRCVNCGQDGTILCFGCENLLKSVPSRCYRCHKVSRQSRVCPGCRSSVQISHVWIANEYDDLAKKLIYKLKFDRAKDVSKKIAEIMTISLPALPADTLITHIPTANNRVRIRGYDQSALIAKNLAKFLNLQHQTVLYRTGKSRQVGSGRKERFVHLQQALHFRPKADISDRHILLVDDITTTGATIEAAAKILKDNGAKTIDAAVFAQPIS